MGPCLDVLTNARNQPLGVRSTGDDPQEVSSYGIAFMNGYKEAGLATMGKHFPSYGSLEFLGSALDVPTITESLEQLSLNALVPFRNAIREGLDAMMVGGCAMSSVGLNVMHACLSEQVVNDLLRNDLQFNGVVISDCLEMEALSHNIGVGGGTVMAVNAGCDIVLLCRSYVHQQEALASFKARSPLCGVYANIFVVSLTPLILCETIQVVSQLLSCLSRDGMLAYCLICSCFSYLCPCY
jgi:beta-N-acetylhexosaminidase